MSSDTGQAPSGHPYQCIGTKSMGQLSLSLSSSSADPDPHADRKEER